VATKELQVAVNAAIALERPLLVNGEPGTGKTILAHEVARGIARGPDHLAHRIDEQGAAGAL
jgi:MoxR-like ATPase